MKYDLIEEKEILELEKEIGYELIVHERPSYMKYERFYVHFENAMVVGNGTLLGKIGNGNTIDEALKDYCKQISCNKMRFGQYTDNVKEIVLPKLIYTSDSDKLRCWWKSGQVLTPSALCRPLEVKTKDLYELWIETHKHHPLFALQLKPEVKLLFKGEQVTIEQLTEILNRK